MDRVPRPVLIALSLLGGSCVDSLPVENRPCPCEAGFTCCAFTGLCLAGGQVCHAPEPDARYLPLRTGAAWEYDLTEFDGTRQKKTQVVGEMEPVPPIPPETVSTRRAFKVRTEVRNFNNGSREVTESWQEDLGTRVVRHHERSFDAGGDRVREEWWEPGRLRLDEGRLGPGPPVPDDFVETRIEPGREPRVRMEHDEWTYLGEERISVPALGTFHCVKVRRNDDKTYWFARGVGKVMERGRGDGQTEILTRFSVPR